MVWASDRYHREHGKAGEDSRTGSRLLSFLLEQPGREFLFVVHSCCPWDTRECSMTINKLLNPHSQRQPSCPQLLLKCQCPSPKAIITHVLAVPWAHMHVLHVPLIYLQSASGWVPAMDSGMTVACWTEVWVATPVSCCQAGGSRICCVPLGHACC